MDTYGNKERTQHPPPLPDPHECNPEVVCNCSDYPLEKCAVSEGSEFYDFFAAELVQGEKQGYDEGGMNDSGREPNNKQRKRCYRHCAFVLGYDRERERLPNCVERAIRRIWPSATGRYMGFREV